MFFGKYIFRDDMVLYLAPVNYSSFFSINAFPYYYFMYKQIIVDSFTGFDSRSYF